MISEGVVLKAGPYNADGATTNFTFSFNCFSGSHVRVVLTDSTDVETDLALTTDFTVNLNADQNSSPGGSIDTVATYAAGYKITIVSDVPVAQGLDLTQGGSFNPDNIESALDKAMLVIGQGVEALDRAVKVPISSSTTPEELYTDLITAGDAAVAAAAAAAASQSAASTSATNAATSETNAAASASSASTSATNASNSASAAATSETNAAASAAAAAASYDSFDDRYLGSKAAAPTLDNDGNALLDGALYWNTTSNSLWVYDLGTTTWIAPASSTEAAAAAASAAAAATSETNAAASASSASTSATNASNSASAAATSETNASNSASAAATSATNASNSAAAAAASYDSFDDRYLGAKAIAPTLDNDGNALLDGALYFNTTSNDMWVYDLGTTTWIAPASSTSANAAAASAAAAATSETNAAASASSASTSATNASNSASAASTSATNASNSASAAATSETNAAASAAAAAASYDSFDDRYLGAKATPPTLDNDGNALVAGAMYFDTAANRMSVYSGTAWGAVELLYFDEEKNTTAPNATVPVYALKVQGAGVTAPYDLALDFKGYSASAGGAFSLQIPDNTATGGNKRGYGSIDLSPRRTSAGQVASGTNSILIGGNASATAANAVAIGFSADAVSGDGLAFGSNAYAGGQFSCAFGSSATCNDTSQVALGYLAYAEVTAYGAIAIGESAYADTDYAIAIGVSASVDGLNALGIGSNPSAWGDNTIAIGSGAHSRSINGKRAFSTHEDAKAQHCDQVLRATTTDATATTLTSDDAAATTNNQFILQNTSLYSFKGVVLARENATGDCAMWNVEGAIKRGANAAATALVGTAVASKDYADAGASAWSIALTADTTNGGLKVAVTGEAAKTIKWACELTSLELIN